MPVPRRRHCPSRTKRARAHKYMEAATVATCPNCGEPVRPHQVCESCGTYRDRSYKVVVKS